MAINQAFSDFFLKPHIKIGKFNLAIVNILELLGLLTVILGIVLGIFFNLTAGWTPEQIQIFAIVYFFPLVLLTLIPLPWMGFNDYRYRQILHFSILAMTLGLYIFDILGILFQFENPSLQGFIILSVILLPIIMGIVLSLFVEVDVYFDKFNQATLEFISGNLDTKITDKRIVGDRTFSKLADNFNSIFTQSKNLIDQLNLTSNIANTAKTIYAAAEEIHTSSESVATTSQSMSDVANEQAQKVQEMFNTLKNTSKTIQQVTQRISANSKTVDEISLETNILALNAGIEASRAGDYGRGFAVVAENVRKLSEESKNAAEEIQKVTDQTIEMLNNAFSTLSQKMEEISALSEETAASSEEVASSAEETSAAIEELTNAIKKLEEEANKASALVKQ